MILLHPAPLGVHGAQAAQQHGLEAVHMLFLDFLPFHGGMESLIRLLEGRFAKGHGIQRMVGNAGAAGVEIFHPAFQRFQYIRCALDFHIGRLAELIHIFGKAGPVHIDGLVRTESREHLGLHAVFGCNGLVIGQIVNGIVGGAQVIHPKFIHQLLCPEIILLQHFAGLFVNSRSGFLVQHIINAKHPLQFQMGPVVKRIANGVGQGFCKGDELFFRVAVAADQVFIHAVRQHGAPLIMVAPQHQLGNILKATVFSNLLGREMAMIVDNGHFFGGFVIQHPGRFSAQQEIFIHERLHKGFLLFFHSLFVSRFCTYPAKMPTIFAFFPPCITITSASSA